MESYQEFKPKKKQFHYCLPLITNLIWGLNRVALYILCGLCVWGAHLLSLPSKKELEYKKQQLQLAELEEEKTKAKLDERAREYRALQEDPDYMDTHSRDLLGMHIPKETIFFLEKEE